MHDQRGSQGLTYGMEESKHTVKKLIFANISNSRNTFAKKVIAQKTVFIAVCVDMLRFKNKSFKKV